MRLSQLATSKVISIDSSQSIDDAIQLMEKHHIHHLPVTSKKKVVGMLSDRDILTTVGGHITKDRLLPDGSVTGPLKVADIMSRPVHTLPLEASILQATGVFLEKKIHAIPLLDGELLAGILTTADLLAAIITSPDLSDVATPLLGQPIVAFMDEDVITVGPKASMDEVVDLFMANKIRHVPIVAGDVVLGIISDRDIRRALAESSIRDAQAQEAGRMYIGPTEALDIMTSSPHTIDSSTSLRHAADALLSYRIHSILVVADGQLVGILTDSDILRALSEAVLAG